MAQERFRFENLSDPELLAAIKQLACAERAATAQLIRCLAEIDARRLYLGQGCSSLFAYCTQVLHLSEHAAYGRIAAARAVQQFPAVLLLLEEGAITLTTVTLLAGHLTADNYAATLELARHKNKRQVEELVARLRPAPDVPAVVRRLPEPSLALAPAMASSPASTPVAPLSLPVSVQEQEQEPAPPSRREPSALLKPLSPGRYKLQVTLRQETYDRLLRARDLMRHAVPDGELDAVLDRALIALLKDLERVRCAATRRPRDGNRKSRSVRGRAIPAAVRRAVWARDGGRCAFVGAEGRCGETGFLEFHHVLPFADGGAATIENIQLRCRAHNAYEAMQWFSVVRERSAPFAGRW